MDWSQALVLGLVQGLTEFLPISSTAHLRVVPHFVGWEDPGTAFSAVIQLGTLLAVFAYFAADIKELVLAAVPGLRRDGLTKLFNEQVVLDNLNIEMARGELLTLLGHDHARLPLQMLMQTLSGRQPHCNHWPS